MLYGAGVPNEQMMKNAPQVGVATIWWEGNPCNTHCEFSCTSAVHLLRKNTNWKNKKVLDFGKIVKKSLEKQNMLAWQYNAVGVSDAITMGGEGKQSSCYTIITYTTRPYSMSWRKNMLLCQPHHGKEDHI